MGGGRRPMALELWFLTTTVRVGRCRRRPTEQNDDDGDDDDAVRCQEIQARILVLWLSRMPSLSSLGASSSSSSSASSYHGAWRRAKRFAGRPAAAAIIVPALFVQKASPD